MLISHVFPSEIVPKRLARNLRPSPPTDGCALRPPPIPQEIVRAWREEINRLIERGVKGRILLGNLGSPRGLPVSVQQYRPFMTRFGLLGIL